jgi:hypothetical protein
VKRKSEFTYALVEFSRIHIVPHVTGVIWGGGAGDMPPREERPAPRGPKSGVLYANLCMNATEDVRGKGNSLVHP